MTRLFGMMIGAVLGVMMSAHPALADDAAVFSNASLSGSYVYSNSTDGVASFGIITFDGKGQVEIDLRINAPQPGGQRGTVSAQGSGTFSVQPNGIGTASLTMSAGPMAKLDYDFMIVDVEDGVADDVTAVLRSGGVNGQLVQPTWTRRSMVTED